MPGPFNANRDHLDALIDQLEQTGMRVYPIASYTRRLQLVKEINPDAVIMMPHGRMQLGHAQQTIDYLKTKNIPLFAPVSVFAIIGNFLASSSISFIFADPAIKLFFIIIKQ